LAQHPNPSRRPLIAARAPSSLLPAALLPLASLSLARRQDFQQPSVPTAPCPYPDATLGPRHLSSPAPHRDVRAPEAAPRPSPSGQPDRDPDRCRAHAPRDRLFLPALLEFIASVSMPYYLHSSSINAIDGRLMTPTDALLSLPLSINMAKLPSSLPPRALSLSLTRLSLSCSPEFVTVVTGVRGDSPEFVLAAHTAPRPDLALVHLTVEPSLLVDVHPREPRLKTTH
jgi:hypothetical protein